MLTRKIVRFSAVAIVGIIMCGVTIEAKAQIAPALTAPLSCTLSLAGAQLTIQAGADGLLFPHDVPCPLATGTCSEYTYRFTYAGGNISQSFLSVSSDLAIFEASPSGAIEATSCIGDSTTKVGLNVCEQRQVRFNEAASTVNAKVVVTRGTTRVSTAGARKGNSEAYCLIQGPGVPGVAFATSTASRTDRAANNQCDAVLTFGADNLVLSGVPDPNCGFADIPLDSPELFINGKPIKSTNGAPFTFGTGTTTCYPTSNGRAICYCRNPSTPCPN